MPGFWHRQGWHLPINGGSKNPCPAYARGSPGSAWPKPPQAWLSLCLGPEAGLSPRKTWGTGLLAAHPRTFTLLHARAQAVAESFSHGDGGRWRLPSSCLPLPFLLSLGVGLCSWELGRWVTEGLGQPNHSCRGTRCHPSCPQGPEGCLSPAWAWGGGAGPGTRSSQHRCKLAACSAEKHLASFARIAWPVFHGFENHDN